MAIQTIIGLDIGSVRTGIATARSDVRIASPLETVETVRLADRLLQLAAGGELQAVVVGLPRNLEGNATTQTAFVEATTEALMVVFNKQLPFYFIDEALTSVKAEEELVRRGKPYQRGDIDMLSAVYILEDYLSQHERKEQHHV